MSLQETLSSLEERCTAASTPGGTVDPTRCYHLAGPGEPCGPAAGAHCGEGYCCRADNICGNTPSSCCPVFGSPWQYSDDMLKCDAARTPPSPTVAPNLPPPAAPHQLCANSCQNSYYQLPDLLGAAATVGVCDDGGNASATSLCGYGTDCADCGPRNPI